MTKRAADGDIGLQHNLHVADDFLLPEDFLVAPGLLNDGVPRVIGRLHESRLHAERKISKNGKHRLAVPASQLATASL